MTTPEIFKNSNGVEMVLIRHTEDEGFTTMPKSVYDAQQVEHLTEDLPPVTE